MRKAVALCLLSLAIAGESVGEMRAEVFDATGTLIRRLRASVLGDRRMLYRWDGRAADGSLAPSGVNYLRITGASEKTSRRVIVLR